MLSFLFLGSTTFNAQKADAWLIVPGHSVGPVTKEISRARLDLLFGKKNVKDEMVSSGGDAVPELATAVNEDNPSIALTVFWDDDFSSKRQHPSVNARPTFINVCYGNFDAPRHCKWHFSSGISIGTHLKELENLNGKSFKLYGFEWDYSGTVSDWNAGNLADFFGKCGRTLLRLDRLDIGDAASPNERALYEEVGSDRQFSSDNSAMRQLNPAIYSISVEFPKDFSGCSVTKFNSYLR